MTFVDLHNHLVPGVDDGAATVAESLEALRALYAEGVRTLVATPHLLLPHLATDAAIGRALDTQRRAFDGLAEAVALEPELAPILQGQRDRLLPEVLRRAGYLTVGVSANIWISPPTGFNT